MSDLLIIVPTSWKEMHTDWIATSSSDEEIYGWIGAQSYNLLEAIAIEWDDMSLGQHIINAQYIKIEGIPRVYIQVTG